MTLVFVPTPLGNLRDITLRGLDALESCDLLVAEDSRVARKLLSALKLPGKEIWTYQEHNIRAVTPGILERARTGIVAVITDAGTPGISDPGVELVAQARAAGISIEVLPGASAAVGAAVLAGFALRRFVFEGFFPRTSTARRRALQASFALEITSVWYESPQRVIATLADIAEIDPTRRVFALREYTKMHEEQLLGTASEVSRSLTQPVRGELVLVIEGRALEPPAASENDIDDAIDALLQTDASTSAIAKTLVERGYGERRHLYARVTDRKRDPTR
ncbi:MAG: 16S rRNA (cytidine(1402)-2'-O)-methyltransferase [Candidatus Eremiobacteraeota bacterium]|nr:16S rRNA (cytidine(1402)-2'-O)-methyltransferase [Candidatus Eremiobacteraeota bacterium]